MSGVFRIILLIAAGVSFYWYYSRRRVTTQKLSDGLEWQSVFRNELAELKRSIPVGYYVNLLALSKSNIAKEECIARLDELVAKMKEEELDTQSVETLILKVEQDMNLH
jgi:hypothetical protein